VSIQANCELFDGVSGDLSYLLVIFLNLVLAVLRLGLKNSQVGKK
jgi:hypothetical protein